MEDEVPGQALPEDQMLFSALFFFFFKVDSMLGMELNAGLKLNPEIKSWTFNGLSHPGIPPALF